MDRGAWWAKVYGVTKDLGYNLVTKHSYTAETFWQYLKNYHEAMSS